MRKLAKQFRNGRAATSNHSLGQNAPLVVLLALICAIAAIPRPALADPVFRTITLAWNASSSPDVIAYRVAYGTSRGQYWHFLDVGSATTADVPNLIDGMTYYFSVIGFTAQGDQTAPADELVYTVGPGVLLNLSARARVGVGDDVVIAGFIVGGNSRKTIVIRALGPSLWEAGLPQALADPVLSLHGPEGWLAENDNWRDGDSEALQNCGLAPRYDAEAAVVMNLAPGAYTAIVRGAGGGTGTVLLEVYDIGVPLR
ncbi:MAG: fibronectin type III domain-containing protein [Verrucomicrobiota bacterium]|nr:fibronectin type III domain-containing protein [Verrucomicrobiota bacterium]